MSDQISTVICLFKDWREVTACYSVAGPTDAVFFVEAATNEALRALRSRLAALPGVIAVTTHSHAAHDHRARRSGRARRLGRTRRAERRADVGRRR